MAKKQLDHGRKALEIGTDAVDVAALVVDVGSTGGVFAAGKLLWDAVAAGIDRRRRKQAEKYLQLLADMLAEKDAVSLAVELVLAGENDVWETVEEGFRAMLAAINETAKRCIALLVADYIVRRELPDREFQLLGNLLAASDESILRGLLSITTQFVEVYTEPESHNRPRPDEVYSYDILRGKNTEKRIDIYVHRHTVINGKSDEAKQSDGEPSPDNLTVVARLLDRHEFGELPASKTKTMTYASERHPHDGMLVLRVYQSNSVRLRRLHDYLRPVFMEVPSATPA